MVTMEKELVSWLVSYLGYAKLLRMISEVTESFGVSIVWYATPKNPSLKVDK